MRALKKSISGATPSAPTIKRHDSGSDEDLCTDTDAGQSKDSGLTSRLQQFLTEEQRAHEYTKNELQVERAAHDETAEKMVELQHRLEVTLQELANLERFVKMQQQVPVAPDTPQQRERLLREESYLKSRLSYVQSELNGGGTSIVKSSADDSVAPTPGPRSTLPVTPDDKGSDRDSSPTSPGLGRTDLGV